MMKLIIILLIGSQISFAATSDMAAVGDNATQFFDHFNLAAKALRWILALIPVLIIIWGVSNTINSYRTYKEKDAGQHGNTIVQELFNSVMSMAFALTAIFIIYGLFVKVYADPSGGATFVSAWAQLVVNFWREVVDDL